MIRAASMREAKWHYERIVSVLTSAVGLPSTSTTFCDEGQKGRCFLGLAPVRF